MFPVRCFDCRRVIGNRYGTYLHLTSTPFEHLRVRDPARLRRVTSRRRVGPRQFLTEGEALDYLKVKSPCCRVRFLCYVDIPDADPTLLEANTRVEFLNKRPRLDDGGKRGTHATHATHATHNTKNPHTTRNPVEFGKIKTVTLLDRSKSGSPSSRKGIRDTTQSSKDTGPTKDTRSPKDKLRAPPGARTLLAR